MPELIKPKGRPKKYRLIRFNPPINQFSPRGRPGRPMVVELSLDEFEAIRLIDFLGLSQKEVAKFMRVSQQTVSRILKRARRAISLALVEGAMIKIQGGQYVYTQKQIIQD
ncbi:MAG: DUF134 domain-containing protein [Candidatus Omnitrophica bacterium]|nr:DUF134 domain-containing protein [Candidatus Omnitrophota bacterium]